MRHVFLALGLLLLAGVAATFVLQDLAREVMGPGLEQGNEVVATVAETQSVPVQAAEVDGFLEMDEVELDAAPIEPDFDVDSEYSEETPSESEPEFYDPPAE